MEMHIDTGNTRITFDPDNATHREWADRAFRLEERFLTLRERNREQRREREAKNEARTQRLAEQLIPMIPVLAPLLDNLFARRPAQREPFIADDDDRHDSPAT